ncbi:hypothetical protein VTP01DRAFT_521 [Rhizomucor pusillus]|uniref:uncharacterized protein n=1 Tax=Rhizomucor pusillus TaxID=4840 RepID=UPI0037437A61
MLLLSSHRRIDGSCRAVVQTTRIILRVSYNSSALAAVVQNQRLSMNNDQCAFYYPNLWLNIAHTEIRQCRLTLFISQGTKRH